MTNSNIYCTPFGTFNSQPTPGEPLVPINYLTGPGHFSLNVRLAKTFNFGGKPGEGQVGRQGGPGGGGGGGPRGGGGGGRPPGGSPGGPFGGGGPAANTGRYNFTISINARNMFNNVNVATPIGVLTLHGLANPMPWPLADRARVAPARAVRAATPPIAPCICRAFSLSSIGHGPAAPAGLSTPSDITSYYDIYELRHSCPWPATGSWQIGMAVMARLSRGVYRAAARFDRAPNAG